MKFLRASVTTVALLLALNCNGMISDSERSFLDSETSYGSNSQVCFSNTDRDASSINKELVAIDPEVPCKLYKNDGSIEYVTRPVAKQGAPSNEQDWNTAPFLDAVSEIFPEFSFISKENLGNQTPDEGLSSDQMVIRDMMNLFDHKKGSHIAIMRLIMSGSSNKAYVVPIPYIFVSGKDGKSCIERWNKGINENSDNQFIFLKKAILDEKEHKNSFISEYLKGIADFNIQQQASEFQIWAHSERSAVLALFKDLRYSIDKIISKIFEKDSNFNLREICVQMKIVHQKGCCSNCLALLRGNSYANSCSIFEINNLDPESVSFTSQPSSSTGSEKPTNNILPSTNGDFDTSSDENDRMDSKNTEDATTSEEMYENYTYSQPNSVVSSQSFSEDDLDKVQRSPIITRKNYDYGVINYNSSTINYDYDNLVFDSDDVPSVLNISELSDNEQESSEEMIENSNSKSFTEISENSSPITSKNKLTNVYQTPLVGMFNPRTPSTTNIRYEINNNKLQETTKELTSSEEFSIINEKSKFKIDIGKLLSEVSADYIKRHFKNGDSDRIVNPSVRIMVSTQKAELHKTEPNTFKVKEVVYKRRKAPISKKQSLQAKIKLFEKRHPDSIVVLKKYYSFSKLKKRFRIYVIPKPKGIRN